MHNFKMFMYFYIQKTKGLKMVKTAIITLQSTNASELATDKASAY